MISAKKADEHKAKAVACRDREKKIPKTADEISAIKQQSFIATAPLIPSESEMAQVIASATVDKKELITIVSGLPRAGTSMMMQMLNQGGLSCLTDKRREADEDNPRGYFEFEPVKQLRTDQSWLPNAKGQVVKIIAQLLPFLPQKYHYRVIFMERDIHEILVSQTKMIERNGKMGAKLSQEQLYRAFSKQIQQIKIHLRTRKIPTLYVSHRDAIESPEKTAAAVQSFMGDTLNEEKMAQAVDSTLYRQQAIAEEETGSA